MASFDPANLRLRIVSALVLAPLVLLAVYLGGIVYYIAVAIVAALAGSEWLNLTAMRRKLMLAGIPYIGGFAAALLYLRAIPNIGMAIIYYLLVVVWGTDIGAFAAGRLIGGPRLAPAISPGKTWAGLLGGMALAGLLGYGAGAIINFHAALAGLGFAILLALVAQLGDLFESWVKRRAGVKESGNLIPGHGGLLDRIDGLIFAVNFFALLAVAASFRT